MSMLLQRIWIAMLVLVLGACSSMNPNIALRQEVSALKEHRVLDPDGNHYPVRKMPDDLWWMTANLNLNGPGSYCYENAMENCKKYGRLYTWQTAQDVCASLGKGWDLPSEHQWLVLTRQFGFPVDSVPARKLAFNAMQFDARIGFNAVLGGARRENGEFARQEAHGFYWTATSSSDSTAWFYNFAKGSQSLYRQPDGEKEQALSVRCVNDRKRIE